MKYETEYKGKTYIVEAHKGEEEKVGWFLVNKNTDEICGGAAQVEMTATLAKQGIIDKDHIPKRMKYYEGTATDKIGWEWKGKIHHEIEPVDFEIVNGEAKILVMY